MVWSWCVSSELVYEFCASVVVDGVHCCVTCMLVCVCVLVCCVDECML